MWDYDEYGRNEIQLSLSKFLVDHYKYDLYHRKEQETSINRKWHEMFTGRWNKHIASGIKE